MTTKTNPAHLNASNRHEFVLIFDVKDGNPNGDPENGNRPRMDIETGQGNVSAPAIKRKIRNYVDAAKGNEGRFKIYMQHGAVLNQTHERAYEALKLDKKTKSQKSIEQTRQWMCENFYDIRTFGAVMSNTVNCGQVRGPVQINQATSVEPLSVSDVKITRVALTNLGPKQDPTETVADTGTMGNQYITPHAVFVTQGFVVPSYGRDTNFSDEDLELLWQALINMWDLDRSSSRGLTGCRGLYVFSHDTPLGNAPAHQLLERINVTKKEDVDTARKFSDYEVQVDDQNLPTGVTLTRLVG